MSDAVNHPDYYGGEDDLYEVIKVAEAWGLDEDAYLFNVLKYVGRPGKGTYLEDLKKAQFYLARRIAKIEALKEKLDSDGLKTPDDLRKQEGVIAEEGARALQALGAAYEYVTVFTPDAKNFCAIQIQPGWDTVKRVAWQAAHQLKMPHMRYTLATWCWYDTYAAATVIWKEDVIIGKITPDLKKGNAHLRLEALR